MDYSALEDAVLAALEPLKTNGSVRTLESYGGEFSADSFGQFPIQYPALYVCLSGLESEPANQDDRREVTIEIYAASRNLRGEKDARRGDGRTSGAYELIESARGKINRLALAGAGRLTLKRERLIGYSKALGLCVIQAEYHLKFQQSLAIERK